MIKRIIVGLSGSPYTPSAIEHAIDLAKRHGAELTGVTIIDETKLADVGPIPMGAAAAASELAEHRLKVAQERVGEAIALFDRTCQEAGVRHHVDRESGRAVDALIDEWRYHDLGVFGVRGLFEYGVVHYPADQALRAVARGVRPILAVSVAPRKIQRVLIAYNGSLESADAMKDFVQLRPWPDAEIRIITIDLGKGVAAGLLRDASAYCTAHGFDVETVHVDGNPTKVLPQHASDWNADLMVIGPAGRSRLAKLLLGDTTVHMMKTADIPLFLSK